MISTSTTDGLKKIQIDQSTSAITQKVFQVYCGYHLLLGEKAFKMEQHSYDTKLPEVEVVTCTTNM